MTRSPAANEADLEAAGRVAFEQGKLAVTCPYTFINSPFWDRKDYEGFDRECRRKMNAWMKGWIDAQKGAQKRK